MPATHKTYLSAEKHYLNFCKSFSFVPLPTSEGTLCYFVASLGQQGLTHTTIRTYSSEIRQLQITHDFQDPVIDQMPRLRQILKGVNIECGKQGKVSCSRLPITSSILIPAGIQDSTIQTLGRWKSASYLLYIHVDPW